MATRRAHFRPCIDLHDGAVKQIVGSSLRDLPAAGAGAGASAAAPQTNFVASEPAAHFARRYCADGLRGGHVIMLGGGDANTAAALSALAAFPGGMQVGGGITPANARTFLDAGASHVIVTSYIFSGGALDWARLAELVAAVGGAERLVIDLSCRRRDAMSPYFVMTDRWQTWTHTAVTPELLSSLSAHCAELLVHAVDVEGKRGGIEGDLVSLLGAHSPIPVTYAGGVRDISDVELVATLGRGRVDVSVGSALDIFGGSLPYDDLVLWDRRMSV